MTETGTGPETSSEDTLVLCVREDGAIEGLYDDGLALDELGDLEVKRASNVEFDAASRLWVAETEGGEVIARNRRRSECIRREIRHFHARFLAGFRAF